VVKVIGPVVRPGGTTALIEVLFVTMKLQSYSPRAAGSFWRVSSPSIE